MNIPNTGFSSKEDITESLNKLKQTAQTREDIEAWFVKHANDLGITSSKDVNYCQTSVALEYTIYDIVKYYEQQWADLDIRIQAVARVTVEDSNIHNPHLDVALRAYGNIVSKQTVEVTFQLNMEEWPFMTSSLLLARLSDYIGDADGLTLGYADKILDYYIPKHFPGQNLSFYLSLKDNGLLPVDRDGEIDDAAIRTMLFNNAASVPYVNLPNSLSAENDTPM